MPDDSKTAMEKARFAAGVPDPQVDPSPPLRPTESPAEEAKGWYQQFREAAYSFMNRMRSPSPSTPAPPSGVPPEQLLPERPDQSPEPMPPEPMLSRSPSISITEVIGGQPPRSPSVQDIEEDGSNIIPKMEGHPMRQRPHSAPPSFDRKDTIIYEAQQRGGGNPSECDGERFDASDLGELDSWLGGAITEQDLKQEEARGVQTSPPPRPQGRNVATSPPPGPEVDGEPDGQVHEPRSVHVTDPKHHSDHNPIPAELPNPPKAKAIPPRKTTLLNAKFQKQENSEEKLDGSTICGVIAFAGIDILLMGIILGLTGMVGMTLATGIVACGGICMLGGGIGAYTLYDTVHIPQQSDARFIDIIHQKLSN